MKPSLRVALVPTPKVKNPLRTASYPIDAQKDVLQFTDDERIAQKQSKHAKKVWNVFGGKKVGDYHDLYLKTYVCLLTILENTTN